MVCHFVDAAWRTLVRDSMYIYIYSLLYTLSLCVMMIAAVVFVVVVVSAFQAHTQSLDGFGCIIRALLQEVKRLGM